MPLIIPPGYGSAAFVLTAAQGTSPFVTTIGVDLSGAGGDFVQAANELWSAYYESFAAVTWNGLTLDHVTLSVGSDGPGGSVDSTTAPLAMSRTLSNPAPVAMAPIMRKTTNELGRRGRGRMFLPGAVSEPDVDPDGSVIQSWRNTLAAAGTDFVDLLTNGGVLVTTPMPPVLLHSAPPGLPTPIVGLTPSDIVGWVRGRIR